MLVRIGATPEGKKELVGFQIGGRESAQSWRELLIDIKQRGFEIAPDLAVGGGAPVVASCGGMLGNSRSLSTARVCMAGLSRSYAPACGGVRPCHSY
jgi:hypothetical protein